jgi:hypothetical protein
MKIRQFLSCAAAACVLSVGLFAQTRSSATPTPPPDQRSSTEANHVTVTGCVERADQVQPAAATTTVDSLSFVLIKPKAEKPTGTTGTTEVGSDANGANSDRMYRLDASVDQLNPHVGHKVEITGTVADNMTAPAGAGSSTNAPRLKVESVKMLEPTCAR